MLNSQKNYASVATIQMDGENVKSQYRVLTVSHVLKKIKKSKK